MIVDTNILVRAAISDDPVQTEQARRFLRDSERLHVTNAVLCEFVWVASRIYRKSRADIAGSIRLLAADEKIVCERDAVSSGLTFLEAGGDFADGVIAFEGGRLGGRVFATFDRKAAKILRETGRDHLLLGREG